MFVEDKLSTLTAVAASPGFEAWELYLGASRMECLDMATMSSGLSPAHSRVAHPSSSPVAVDVCAVTWGYNTEAERASVAKQQRIKLLELPQFSALMRGQALS